MDSFACCLESALSKVDQIIDVDHLYETTRHCDDGRQNNVSDFDDGRQNNVSNFDDGRQNNVSDFISAVISFYIHQTDNLTTSCGLDLFTKPTNSFRYSSLSLYLKDYRTTSFSDMTIMCF